MLNMANNSRLLMKPEAAEKMAAELNASDPDWTYKVKYPLTGTGWALIEVYDEDGEFVDVWKMS